MMRTCTVALALIACAAPAFVAMAAPAAPAPGDLGDGNVALAPIRYESLALLPVVTTSTGGDVDYLTLDEGMAARQVRIGEIADGSVNELEIRNRADRPLFLLAGEVVLGGKQDRIIGKNTVIPARTSQRIPVFCVEHGRWSGRHADFSSAGALAHEGLRAKASFDDQGAVWAEVSSKNGKRRTGNDTDTYRRVAAQQTGGTLASWEKALRAGVDKLPAAERKRMVGYAVALNGEIVAVDVFGSPALFAKLEKKLVRSYITEAIDAPTDAQAKAASAGDVRGFVQKAEAAPAAKVYESDAADTLNTLGEGAASTRVMRKGDAAARPVFKSAHKK